MAKFIWQDGTLVSKAKVEIGGTIYEVDPEEYSGTTPLSASNLNAMQDGIYEDIDEAKEEIENKTTYSTQEQVIGKWINNKPIYRKVLDITNIGASGIEYNHGILNFGVLVDVYGSWDRTSAGRQPLIRTLPATDANNAYAVSIGDITDTSFRLHYGTQVSGITHIYVIFEYTKTTD